MLEIEMHSHLLLCKVVDTTFNRPKNDGPGRTAIRPIPQQQRIHLPRRHPATHLQRPLGTLQHLRLPLLSLPMGRFMFPGTSPSFIHLCRSSRTMPGNNVEIGFSSPQALDEHDNMLGVVISKLEPHRGGPMRGYIAMLAVKKEHRGKGIATKLVRMAIDVMIERDADEVGFHLPLHGECNAR